VDKLKLRRADLVTSIILFLFSAFVFVNAIELLSNTLRKEKDWYVSAGLFPLIISVFLALCAYLLFSRARKDGAKLDFIKTENIKSLISSKEFKVATFIIGLLAFYIFVLLEVLPYWLATFIYLYVFMFTFQKKTKKHIIIMSIVAVLSTIALTYGFGTLAMIPLP